jgi:hypothetical protein
MATIEISGGAIRLMLGPPGGGAALARWSSLTVRILNRGPDGVPGPTGPPPSRGTLVGTRNIKTITIRR